MWQEICNTVFAWQAYVPPQWSSFCLWGLRSKLPVQKQTGTTSDHAPKRTQLHVQTQGDVVEVLKTKGTTTDICLVMKIFGSSVPSVRTKTRTKGTEILIWEPIKKKALALKRYHCERCGKVMRFSTQLKQHRVTGCDVLDLHVETPKGDSKTPWTLFNCNVTKTFSCGMYRPLISFAFKLFLFSKWKRT